MIFSLAWNIIFPNKSWQKYDIYWLLESSCFELFSDGKYGFFWVKKLMERWYSLVTEKFLFWTSRWWEIRCFFRPKGWWKDDNYVVFLSFLRYSRTWEIWFFAQCKVFNSNKDNKHNMDNDGNEESRYECNIFEEFDVIMGNIKNNERADKSLSCKTILIYYLWKNF